jgi:Mg-chelatase subunit ChlD
MKFFTTAALAGLAIEPVLGSLQRQALHPRQTTDDTCNIQLAQSKGGRKIAIVLDSSGSMEDNDPQNLRIQAGKALNGQLVTGTNPDVVTVVELVSWGLHSVSHSPGLD